MTSNSFCLLHFIENSKETLRYVGQLFWAVQIHLMHFAMTIHCTYIFGDHC